MDSSSAADVEEQVFVSSSLLRQDDAAIADVDYNPAFQLPVGTRKTTFQLRRNVYLSH